MGAKDAVTHAWDTAGITVDWTFCLSVLDIDLMLYVIRLVALSRLHRLVVAAFCESVLVPIELTLHLMHLVVVEFLKTSSELVSVRAEAQEVVAFRASCSDRA
jgi:hypothetical protein